MSVKAAASLTVSRVARAKALVSRPSMAWRVIAGEVPAAHPVSRASWSGGMRRRQDRRSRQPCRDSPSIGSRLRGRGRARAGPGPSSTGGRPGAVVVEDRVPGPAALPRLAGLLRRENVLGDVGDLARAGVEVGEVSQAD